MSQLTQERLKQVLHYNHDTGLFTRLGNGPDNVGSIDGWGYLKIQVDYKIYCAHRLAFLYMTGKWPKNQVDHINTIKLNNWWSNLREANNQQNQENIRKARKQNKCGFLGVSSLSGNRFQATISIKGKKRHLGVFKTPEEAHQCYLIAKRQIHEFNTL